MTPPLDITSVRVTLGHARQRQVLDVVMHVAGEGVVELIEYWPNGQIKGPVESTTAEQLIRTLRGVTHGAKG